MTVLRVIIEGNPAINSTASGVGTVVFDSAAVAASYSFDIRASISALSRLRLHYAGKMIGGNHRPIIKTSRVPHLPRTVDALSIRHALIPFQRTALLIISCAAP